MSMTVPDCTTGEDFVEKINPNSGHCKLVIWFTSEGEKSCSVLYLCHIDRQNQKRLTSCPIISLPSMNSFRDGPWVKGWYVIMYAWKKKLSQLQPRLSLHVMSKSCTYISDWVRSPTRTHGFRVQSKGLHLVPVKSLGKERIKLKPNSLNRISN